MDSTVSILEEVLSDAEKVKEIIPQLSVTARANLQKAISKYDKSGKSRRSSARQQLARQSTRHSSGVLRAVTSNADRDPTPARRLNGRLLIHEENSALADTNDDYSQNEVLVQGNGSIQVDESGGNCEAVEDDDSGQVDECCQDDGAGQEDTNDTQAVTIVQLSSLTSENWHSQASAAVELAAQWFENPAAILRGHEKAPTTPAERYMYSLECEKLILSNRLQYLFLSIAYYKDYRKLATTKTRMDKKAVDFLVEEICSTSTKTRASVDSGVRNLVNIGQKLNIFANGMGELGSLFWLSAVPLSSWRRASLENVVKLTAHYRAQNWKVSEQYQTVAAMIMELFTFGPQVIRCVNRMTWETGQARGGNFETASIVVSQVQTQVVPCSTSISVSLCLRDHSVFSKWTIPKYVQQLSWHSTESITAQHVKLHHIEGGPSLEILCSAISSPVAEQTILWHKTINGWQHMRSTAFALVSHDCLDQYIYDCMVFMSQRLRPDEKMSDRIISECVALVALEHQVIFCTLKLWTAHQLLLTGWRLGKEGMLEMSAVTDQHSFLFGTVPAPRTLQNELDRRLEQYIADNEQACLEMLQSGLQEQSGPPIVYFLTILLMLHIRERDIWRLQSWIQVKPDKYKWRHPEKPNTLLERSLYASDILLSFIPSFGDHPALQDIRKCLEVDLTKPIERYSWAQEDSMDMSLCSVAFKPGEKLSPAAFGV